MFMKVEAMYLASYSYVIIFLFLVQDNPGGGATAGNFC